MTGSPSSGLWSAPITLRVALTRALASPQRERRLRVKTPRARAHRLRVRAHHRAARPGPERRRAGDVLAALVGALRLQALAEAARTPPDGGRARGHGPRRERGSRGRRQWARGRLQGRVPQPSERGGALPGRGDRGRRDPAGRLRDRRSADRGARLAALRRARLGSVPLPVRGSRRGDRALRQLDRRPECGRRGLLRAALRAQLPRQRDVRGPRAHRRDDPLRGRRARATCW